jgi:hypothetical protein
MLKMFVLRLFNKFMPLYPTLMGCRRFHSTHKVGPWTPLISNPSNVLSAVLKTRGNGGWLTAVAHWHMRYSLRQISRRRHDRASELCVLEPIRSESHCVWLRWCTVGHASFGATVRHCHTRRALARLQLGRHFTQPSPMPPFLPNIIRIVVNCAYAWLRPIIVEAGNEVLQRAEGHLVGWAARCV